MNTRETITDMVETGLSKLQHRTRGEVVGMRAGVTVRCKPYHIPQVRYVTPDGRFAVIFPAWNAYMADHRHNINGCAVLRFDTDGYLEHTDTNAIKQVMPFVQDVVNGITDGVNAWETYLMKQKRGTV